MDIRRQSSNTSGYSRYGYSQKEVARYIGIHYSTISRVGINGYEIMQETRHYYISLMLPVKRRKA